MLNAGQEAIRKAAINWFYNSSEQVFEISGGAGTGKTFLIWEILKSLNLNPYEYLAMAYTGQASSVMRTRGFVGASTIHSTIYELVEVENKYKSDLNKFYGITAEKKFIFRLRKNIPDTIRLLFIDEATMVPQSMVKDILSFGVKVITCGDIQQLPPVHGEPGFLRNPSKIHYLTEIMRQSEGDPIVYLANRAIRGEPIHAGTYGNVLVIDDTDLIPEHFDYADCIICAMNRTRDVINSYMRTKLGFTSSPLPQRGERIICRKNDWNLSIDGIALCNGLTGTVLSPLDVSKYNNVTYNLDFKPDLVNGVFEDLDINAEYICSPYPVRQSIKATNANLKYDTGELFEYAYAISCWLAQGSEYNNGIYIEEFMRPQIQNNLNYTGITRFKNSMIYVKKTRKFFDVPKPI